VAAGAAEVGRANDEEEDDFRAEPGRALVADGETKFADDAEVTGLRAFDRVAGFEEATDDSDAEEAFCSSDGVGWTITDDTEEVDSGLCRLLCNGDWDRDCDREWDREWEREWERECAGEGECERGGLVAE
jgi:hypothetical protein